MHNTEHSVAIEGGCPPPAWHCNHCELTIWKTSDLPDLSDEYYLTSKRSFPI